MRTMSLALCGVLIGCGNSGPPPPPPFPGAQETASASDDRNPQDTPAPPRGLAPGERKTVAGIEFAWIPPGTFWMGSPESEIGHESNELQHEVTLTKGFWMSTTEVTQAAWEAAMGSNPSEAVGPNLPVDHVSFNDAFNFMRTVGTANGVQLRFPTEAEWEYACRAGSQTAFCSGDGDQSVLDFGWFEENSGRVTQPVAQLRPNAWGLYDMHGNLAEWCHGSMSPYAAGPVTDPPPPPGGFKVVRGGSRGSLAVYARSANRDDNDPDSRLNWIGFRLASNRL